MGRKVKAEKINQSAKETGADSELSDKFYSLRELEDLHTIGIITDEEYKEQVMKIKLSDWKQISEEED